MNQLRMTIVHGQVKKQFDTQYTPHVGDTINFAADQLRGCIKSIEWIRLNEVIITLG